MNIEANLYDRSIRVSLGLPEIKNFISEKVILKRDEAGFYWYDNGLEYSGEYYLELEKRGGRYNLLISRIGSDERIRDYLVISFEDLEELRDAATLIMRKCRRRWLAEWERKILESRVREEYPEATCQIDADFGENLLPLTLKMLEIGRRLRLFPY